MHVLFKNEKFIGSNDLLTFFIDGWYHVYVNKTQVKDFVVQH